MSLNVSIPGLQTWLPAQRWYSAKDHPITGVRIEGAAGLGAEGPWLARVRTTHRDQPRHISWLLCLTAVDADHPGRIGTVDGRHVADIADAPEGAAAITSLIDLDVRPFSTNDLPLQVISGRRRSATPQGTARVIQGDQSNTSIVVGSARIVKIIRRLSPGPNPEVELTWALTEAGVHGIPALHGAVVGPDETAMVLQSAFIPDTTNGWDLALDEARGEADHGLLRRDEAGSLFVLGRVIRDVHDGLQSLGVSRSGSRRAALRSLGRRLRHDAASTVAALRRAGAVAEHGVASTLDDDAVDVLDVTIHGRVRDALGALAADRAAPPRLQRVHGDLHLGQVLRDPEHTWWVTDFEGEQGRPAEHRRSPAPAAVDLAGMVRSLDYVAGTAIRQGASAVDSLAWSAAATRAFLDGYGVDGDDVWLKAMALDKLLYELRHEAVKRPGWLSLPLAALDTWLPSRTQRDRRVAMSAARPPQPRGSESGTGGARTRISTYQVHLGTWRWTLDADDRPQPTDTPTAAQALAAHCADLGFTHVEVLDGVDLVDGDHGASLAEHLAAADVGLILPCPPEESTARRLAGLPAVQGLRITGLGALLDTASPESGRAGAASVVAMTDALGEAFPHLLRIADSPATWPLAAGPPHRGGLGFDLQTDPRWTRDLLDYFGSSQSRRRWRHHLLTAGMRHAAGTSLLLELPGRRTADDRGGPLAQMAGDRWQRFANLRALHALLFAHPGAPLMFQGAELGDVDAWAPDAPLDWSVRTQPGPAGVLELTRDLNRAHRDLPSLWRRDGRAGCVEWIDADDAEHRTLSFVRWGEPGDAPVAVVANLATQAVRDVRLGLPRAGVWREVLNTDGARYGGTNTGNWGRVVCDGPASHNFAQSGLVTVPPLGVIWLVAEG